MKGNSKGTHLGFLHKWTKWTQKSRLGHEMTRSGCLRIRSMLLRQLQAYPSDRPEEMATHPRRAPPPRVTSARSQGKWSLIFMKLEIQGLFINLQVGFDGRHKKLTESTRSTKTRVLKKEGLFDNWMKIMKTILTSQIVIENTCGRLRC